MHPSSGEWNDFRYTLASWLLPRASDSKLIDIFQPVAATANDVWTDSLLTCLAWLESGKEGRVLENLLHIKPAKPQVKRKAKKKNKSKGKRKPVQKRLDL
jgi:hypothetical protein